MNLFQELNFDMVKYSFSPKKKLGQHFLIDEKVLQKIVLTANLSSKDIVLEIGSGSGILSKELIKTVEKVIGVELDSSLVKLLSEKFKEFKNFKLIEGDFLSIPLPKFNKIVSCPPYGISSDIMNKLFSIEFDLAVFVFQKEFAEKLVSEPGFPDYTALSVLSQFYFFPTLIQEVDRNAFFPKPKERSTIIKLIPQKRFGETKNNDLFNKFIKTIFRFKNKNLSNGLKQALRELKEFKKEKIQKFIESNELSAQKIQLIEVYEFVEIFNELF